MKQIQLFSAYHKEGHIPNSNFVSSIQVGTNFNNILYTDYQDNTLINISYKNKNYNELTACYWVWKNFNRKEIDIWGLCHYRRYFMLPKYKYFLKLRSRKYFAFNPNNLNEVLNEKLYKHLQKELSTSDVIIQYPALAHKERGKIYTIEEAYCYKHSPTDWFVTKQVILEKYPRYEKSFLTFSKMTVMSYYNMMVAPWYIWDDYLNWLFDILFEVENRITLSEDAYQERVFGFLSERLLNLYVYHNQLSVSYNTIALFEK
ncbi:MAG: DUF4422 domain-containing protein [Flavobacterium sp.]|nr:DUF4422 domain-containing protein [Flavobacterium sp.]